MARHPDIDPGRLPERLAALPGVELLRELARKAPAYLVGGAVRDLLRGESRTDLDVVVEADVEPLADELGGEVVSHERFATAKVKTGELVLDLAQARTEAYPEPGALPDVRPATLAKDLARRDFTINAMALPIVDEPELVDPHDGLDDLRSGLLRVLHDDSFRDDPTRALRAARYAARFDFDLEESTERFLRDADLSTVSGDRVTAELRKLAAEAAARRGFELAAEWGLVNLNEGALELIDAVTKLLGGPTWEGFADREPAVLLAAVGDLTAARELGATRPDAPSRAVELARSHGPVELVVARALGAEWLDRYVFEWRHVDLEIDGDDLIEAGIDEGPAIGEGLSAALNAKLDGEISTRDEELRVALAAARDESRGD